MAFRPVPESEIPSLIKPLGFRPVVDQRLHFQTEHDMKRICALYDCEFWFDDHRKMKQYDSEKKEILIGLGYLLGGREGFVRIFVHELGHRIQHLYRGDLKIETVMDWFHRDKEAGVIGCYLHRAYFGFIPVEAALLDTTPSNETLRKVAEGQEDLVDDRPPERRSPGEPNR